MNQRMFLRRALYRLKRNYGVTAILYHLTSEEGNVETGRATIEITKYVIKKVIVPPASIERQLILDTALFRRTAVGVTRAGHDVLDRTVIIDSKDLPTTFEFSINDYLLINDVRYNIRSANVLEQQLGIELRVSTIKGQPRNKIFDEDASSTLTLTHSAVTT